MKRFSKAIAVACLSTMALSGAAHAQDVNGAVKARKALMQLYAHYLGGLGAMAKGEVDYDADKAAAMASSLAAVSASDQSAMWPAGSDTDALGEATAALPVIWTTFPAIAESGKQMGEAVAKLNEVAGTDLASLQGAMGAVGQACGSCHKTYRLKRN